MYDNHNDFVIVYKLFDLFDAKVKAQVRNRVEKSRETQTLITKELPTHTCGKGKSKADTQTTYCYSI